MIPFNRPFYPPTTLKFIQDSLATNHISGDGKYSHKIKQFFDQKFGLRYNLMTTSCTDALELIALTIDLKKEDEVILPSYTFVSTANPFLLRGAKLIFADSCNDSPNIDLDHVRQLITKKTKAIVIVHYAGIPCDIEKLIKIKKDFSTIYIVEDAAQCVDSFYKGTPLGSFGDFSAFSFHETKNISCGEGGLFVSKEKSNYHKAEIIREKGTNRMSFIRGEVNKYGWKTIGSSFLPSDILAAILWAQLQEMGEIKSNRKKIWNNYYEGLECLESSGKIIRPKFSPQADHNAHIFYLITRSETERNQLIQFLAERSIKASFHYLSLHKSNFFKSKTGNDSLPNSDKYTSCLVRLPMFNQMNIRKSNKVIENIQAFFK
ncbi:MAG: dTDP-4-amino-4,6-dideoxygalactose transaminase [Flavobacteriales bacterium]|nr:dTDP-4-amino-4,6-dideoxygalactose transaminase [Flavobacteriales bacterium]